MKNQLTKLAWEHWLYGIVWATIGGAATSASAWMAMGAAHASGVDVPALNFKALGVIMLSGALTNFFAVLKQTPLPKDDDETPVPPAPIPPAVH